MIIQSSFKAKLGKSCLLPSVADVYFSGEDYHGRDVRMLQTLRSAMNAVPSDLHGLRTDRDFLMPLWTPNFYDYKSSEKIKVPEQKPDAAAQITSAAMQLNSVLVGLIQPSLDQAQMAVLAEATLGFLRKLPVCGALTDASGPIATGLNQMQSALSSVLKKTHAVPVLEVLAGLAVRSGTLSHVTDLVTALITMAKELKRGGGSGGGGSNSNGSGSGSASGSGSGSASKCKFNIAEDLLALNRRCSMVFNRSACEGIEAGTPVDINVVISAFTGYMDFITRYSLTNTERFVRSFSHYAGSGKGFAEHPFRIPLPKSIDRILEITNFR